MKRLMSLVLIVMVFIGYACAEGFVFSSMSDEELLSVQEQLRQEMVKRNLIEDTQRTLREGKFIIGKDIAPGRYTVTCSGTAGETIGDAYGSLGGMIDAADDESDANWGAVFGGFGDIMGDTMDMKLEIIGDYGDVLSSYTMKNGDYFSITLEEGTALQISDGSCTIKTE